MGYPMAKNVRQKMPAGAGFWIFDVNKDVCTRFAVEFQEYGPIYIAGSAKEVAQNAFSIASIIPTGAHVRSVYLDPNTGILAAKSNEMDKNRVYIECSTIEKEIAVDVASQLQEAGMGQYVDCPVSVR